MKLQFQLRSLMLFVLWIALGLLVNLQVRQIDRWFYQHRNIIAVTYGQGWPLDHTQLYRANYSAIYVPAKNGWTIDPQSPLEVETQSYGKTLWIVVLIDVVIWLVLYFILYKLISLVNYFRRRRHDGRGEPERG